MTQEEPEVMSGSGEEGVLTQAPGCTDAVDSASDSAAPSLAVTEGSTTSGESKVDHEEARQDEPVKSAESGDDDLAALEEECDVAADYLEELLDIADLDGDIDSYLDGGRAHVSVITDAEVLVGPDAEVLEALQELCRLVVMTDTGRRSRLMLDIGGHRDRRRVQLRELAADAIVEVKSSGDAVTLASMNPFERKIIHDAVAEAGFRSESEGEEPRRRVVVMPTA